MTFQEIAEFVILMVVVACLMLYPLGRILNRIGFSNWWLLLFLVPGAPILGLWLLAYAKWPKAITEQ